MTDWKTEGVLTKPNHCKLCPCSAIGRSFCPDYLPKDPKVAFILDQPSKGDTIERTPWSDAQGTYWTKIFIEDLGYKKEDVLISHAIRCVQPNDTYGKPSYPSGFVKKPAELNCRYYDGKIQDINGSYIDGGLYSFDPSLFLLCLHPRTILVTGSNQRQIIRVVEKAFHFYKLGHRPAVLFGEGPSELYFPWLKGNGGMKTWAGHWWEGYSPFKDNERNKKSLSRKLFVEGCSS